MSIEAAQEVFTENMELSILSALPPGLQVLRFPYRIIWSLFNFVYGFDSAMKDPKKG